MNQVTRRDAAFAGVCVAVLSVVWISVFAYSIHAAMPYNPISLPLSQKLHLNVLLIQGWKFFTRNPREDDIFVFKQDENGQWSSALIGTNGSPQNVFGLRRATRAQGIEIGLITTTIKTDEWSECKERAETCVANAPLVGYRSIQTPEPTLCGEVGLVLRPPVPWAWSRAKKEVVMPSKAVRIHLLCSEIF